MPRDGSGVYSVPANTEGVSGQPVSSARYNAFLADLTSALNSPLPVTAGGTGVASLTAFTTNITTTGTITGSSVVGTSDAALKENDIGISGALEALMAIKGRIYNRIGRTEAEAGTFAQDWLHLPGVVGATEDGVLTLNPMAQIAYMLEAIKDLKAAIDDITRKR